MDMAEEEIAEMDGSDIVVLVYQDKVELKDANFDAIITQTYGFDEENGYCFGLLYRIVNNKIQFLNERIDLGNVRNFLMF